MEAISSSGVSFNIWEKRNADGTASGLYEWTSMVGNEKKKVLKSLPDKFTHLLPTESADTITQVWKVMLSSPGWHQPGGRYSGIEGMRMCDVNLKSVLALDVGP